MKKLHKIKRFLEFDFIWGLCYENLTNSQFLTPWRPQWCNPHIQAKAQYQKSALTFVQHIKCFPKGLYAGPVLQSGDWVLVLPTTKLLSTSLIRTKNLV